MTLAAPDSAAGATGADRALQALDALAGNPAALKGLTLRARSGPVRDLILKALPGPIIRLHNGMGHEALHGGLDLAQTLSAGRTVHRPGLLARQGWFVLSMAERLPPDLTALLCQALDSGHLAPLIVLDEGAENDERAPAALTERLAFFAEIDAESYTTPRSATPDLTRANTDLRATATEQDVAALTALAARFGIDSLRAPIFALRAAQSLACRAGRDQVLPDDISAAAALTYPHRATQIPQEDPPEESPPDQDETPPPPDTPDAPGEDQSETELPDTLLIDAVQAALPPDMLALLQSSAGRSAGHGSGAGQKRKGNRRGRPLPSRRKRLTGQDRIDLTATLRAAAPWQRLRRNMESDQAANKRLAIWPSDIHVKRYEDRSDRLLIFAVDASGSAALARLGEAKGAVELLLGEAYASRDHVSLIAFRGEGADLLLPPTRSLVQTKRRLAELPGGGGTPLAAALKCVGETAEHAQRHGLTPAIALLTDGRANIALDGAANRAQAQEDALHMARWLRGLNLPGCVLDVGRRTHGPLAELASVLGARYVALPRADATAMQSVLKDTLG